MERSCQLSNVQRKRHESSYNSQDEYPINPHPLHWHTAVLWESGIALWSAFSCPWNRKSGGKFNSRPEFSRLYLSLSPHFFLISLSSPLSLFLSVRLALSLSLYTRPGPLSLYLALKVGKSDITLLMCFFSKKKPHRLSLGFSVSPLQTPAFSRQLKAKRFLFFDNWNLFHSNSCVAQVIPSWLLICLLPSFSSNPHTPLSYLILSLKTE